MKRYILTFIVFALSSPIHASCDVTEFRGTCRIILHPSPTRYASSLVYCGNSYGYVTLNESDQLMRYQRRAINRVLTINGIYADSPCTLGKR